MLPCCERVKNVPRNKYLPSHNRGIPVPNQPTTIGGHLRKRRLELRIHQSEAAARLGVSTVTMSRWECDKVYPTWAQQGAITAYLGHDPFKDPSRGGPQGNESDAVALFSTTTSLSLGQKIRKRRLELKQSRENCAKALGVSRKTLWGWETGRHEPIGHLQRRVEEFLVLDQSHQ